MARHGVMFVKDPVCAQFRNIHLFIFETYICICFERETTLTGTGSRYMYKNSVVKSAMRKFMGDSKGELRAMCQPPPPTRAQRCVWTLEIYMTANVFFSFGWFPESNI